MTATGNVGDMWASGTVMRSTRAPVAHRHSIGVETGSMNR
jgi:hypothetical protein